MSRKRITAALLAAVIMAVLTASMPVASLAADTVTVIVDGRRVSFPDAPAFVDKNGRTQIPVRYVGKAMGMLVEWDNTARRATFSMEMDGVIRHVDFYIGSEVFCVRDSPEYMTESMAMNTAAFIRNNRTYVPVRYLAEAFGATVQWESETRTVRITSGADAVALKPPPQPKDPDMYSDDGMLLPPYANVFYDKWFESLRITYAGERVFVSYTVPGGLPENVDFQINLTCVRTEEAKRDGPEWYYQSFEMYAGDREAGKESGTKYLLPNPVSGDVTKELLYIPFLDIRRLVISCVMATPRDVEQSETSRFAQSAYLVLIFPAGQYDSELRKSAFEGRNLSIAEYTETIVIDVSKIVIFE